MRNILLNAALLAPVLLVLAVLVLALPSLAHADGGARAQARQQAVAVEEHAGHGEHAGTDRVAGRHGMTEGAGKPAAWTAFPALRMKMSGDSRERREITVIPQNIVPDVIEAFSSNLKDASWRRQLPLGMAGAKLDKPESGGFHWLAAREERAETVRVASTIYYFSDRGGKNPAALFTQPKHELEIIPQPFPREHSRYRANEDWEFLVRFNGNPLANQRVTLETRNGTKAEMVSDAQGVINARIPDDFKTVQQPAGGHDHGQPGAEFVLATEYSVGGKTFLTAFNSSYGRDAFDHRSLALGLGFMLLGMIGAAPLLRQRKNAGAAKNEDA